LADTTGKPKLNTSYQEIAEIPCSGGLILDRSIFTMPYGAALELENMESNINGGYSRVKGYSPFSSTALSGTGRVLGIATLGATVIGCRGANVEYGNDTTWTSIATNRTNAGRYSFDKYTWTGTEIIAMADGVNYAATWDGSTYTLLNGAAGAGAGTAPTAPVDVKEFKGYLFFVQGEELTFTAPFDANDFTPGNGAGSLIVGEEIVGIFPQRDELFIFCPNSIYRMTGTSLADFTVVPVSRNIGCRCRHSIREIAGDLIFLAQDGLRTIARTARIDDVEIGTVSKAIQERFSNTPSDCIYSSAVIRGKSQYRIFFPTTDITITNAMGVLGVLKRTLSPKISGDAHEVDYDLGWEFADLKGIKPSYTCSDMYDNQDIVLHGDFDNGIVYKQEDTTKFNGTNISCVFRSSDMPLGDSGLRKVLHRIFLYFATDGTMDLDLSMIYNNSDPDTPQPAPYNITNTVGSVYGTGVYGTATYSTTKTVFIRQPVEGSGWTVSVKITEDDASSDFTLKGFALEFVQTGRK
jgi:hypothetical protein